MNRKLCLQLHFEVKINEPNLIEDDSEEAQEHYARQKRLYDTLVANADSLEAFQVYLLASSLESVSWKDWYNHLLGSPDVDADDILNPIIATLSEEDQQWFKEAEDEGVFYESVEDSIINCHAEIASVNIVEEGGTA